MFGSRFVAVGYTFGAPIVIVGPARLTLYSSATNGIEVDGSFDFVEF
jgi:hypothetical protein